MGNVFQWIPTSLRPIITSLFQVQSKQTIVYFILFYFIKFKRHRIPVGSTLYLNNRTSLLSMRSIPLSEAADISFARSYCTAFYVY
jgi:hypothetical protein